MGNIRTHGVILNLSSAMSFVFTFNPEEQSSVKKINYVVAPNIGGSHKKRFFSGFDSKELSFTLHSHDAQNPMGVKNVISYFEQLRNPDPGTFGIAGSFFGNENYPPPQILLQFGISYIPIVWDVLDISIKASHFIDDPTKGIPGFPRDAKIELSLALDEDNPLNKANMIAEKAAYLSGSTESIVNEAFHYNRGTRKDSYWDKK